jgi:hypothetical protein
MVSILSELELCCIDRMTQENLTQAIRARAADLPADLLDRLDEQPPDRLRLLLLAGRLIQVSRHLRSRG